MANVVELVGPSEVITILKEHATARDTRVYAAAAVTRQELPIDAVKVLPGMISDTAEYERTVDTIDLADYLHGVSPLAACALIKHVDRSAPAVWPPVVEQVGGDNVLMFGYCMWFHALETVKSSTLPCLVVRHVVGTPPPCIEMPQKMPKSVADYLALEHATDRGGRGALRKQPTF